MRVDRFTLDRSENEFMLLDHNTGSTLKFNRDDAKFFFCWLMHRLNVVDATLFNGKSVKGFYHYEEVKNAIESFKDDQG